jgi:hypothetical protein
MVFTVANTGSPAGQKDSNPSSKGSSSVPVPWAARALRREMTAADARDDHGTNPELWRRAVPLFKDAFPVLRSQTRQRLSNFLLSPARLHCRRDEDCFYPGVFSLALGRTRQMKKCGG